MAMCTSRGKKIFWLIHRAQDLSPVFAMMQAVNTYDKQFQEQSDEIIFQTILVANFLDIKSLLELMCKKVQIHVFFFLFAHFLLSTQHVCSACFDLDVVTITCVHLAREMDDIVENNDL
jgi:hypothetical protein